MLFKQRNDNMHLKGQEASTRRVDRGKGGAARGEIKEKLF